MDHISEQEKPLNRGIHVYLPSELAEYYKAVEAKHFGQSEASIGSRFLEVTCLAELLELAEHQRGNLSGDDRDKLVKMGVPETALLPQCRYLVVNTPGEVGIVKNSYLAPDSLIEVIRTKPNTPCSLVFRSTDFPKTDLGVIIIGPNEKQSDESPEPTTLEAIWTVHPGPPISPASEDFWPEGTEITAQDVLDKLGPDAYVNVARPRAIDNK